MYSEGRQQLVSPEHFRAELQAQMERAATRGQKDIVMSALELHVALGVFPRPNHHTATDVMECERKPGDVLLVAKGDPMVSNIDQRQWNPKIMMVSSSSAMPLAVTGD